MRLIETSTSAAGAMLAEEQPHESFLVVIATDSGTSPERVPSEMSYSLRPIQHTNAGVSITSAGSASVAISELRRLSGLTWEQLARLFRVSRRSLHFWASGKAMTPANEEHLQRLIVVLRKVDRGSSAANRTALITADRNGVVPFDLLADERYDFALAMLGQAQHPAPTGPPSLAEKVKLERAPRSPEELIDALHDRVHRETGTARPAKSVRTRGER